MGRTIRMIRGMWGGPHLRDRYRTLFEGRGHHCRTPALRHHQGPPSAPRNPELGTTSLLDYAADLEAEVKALPERPWIVGHSMGGSWRRPSPPGVSPKRSSCSPLPPPGASWR